MQLEINKEVVFSTVHIKPQTEEVLEKHLEDCNAYPNLVLNKLDFGWRIYSGNKDFPLEDFLTGLPDIDELIKIAYQNDCQFVILDSSGPEYPDIKSYDWE